MKHIYLYPHIGQKLPTSWIVLKSKVSKLVGLLCRICPGHGYGGLSYQWGNWRRWGKGPVASLCEQCVLQISQCVGQILSFYCVFCHLERCVLSSPVPMPPCLWSTSCNTSLLQACWSTPCFTCKPTIFPWPHTSWLPQYPQEKLQAHSTENQVTRLCFTHLPFLSFLSQNTISFPLLGKPSYRFIQYLCRGTPLEME